MAAPTDRPPTACLSIMTTRGKGLQVQFTVEDPTLYTKPWTAVRPMPRLANYQIYEYACHEGNYAMSGILGGARADEKAAGAKRNSSSK